MPISSVSAALRAEHMSLFPTLDSLDEVLELAKSKAPHIPENELHSLFMIYHNTLLATVQH
jgi:hypothetical protein